MPHGKHIASDPTFRLGSLVGDSRNAPSLARRVSATLPRLRVGSVRSNIADGRRGLWMMAVLAMGVWLTPVDARADESRGDSPLGTGAVEGTVTYRADPKRPWRNSRLYIERVSTGAMAEAVVALRGRNLKEAKDTPPPVTAVVDQRNYQFTPETLAIRAGDSVKFTNGDGATHNVQASSDLANFNTTMPAGGSQTIAFPRAGGIRKPVSVGCVFHSAMRAWVFVFDHPFFAVTAAKGKFRLAGVPPGEYEIEMVHAAGELRWRGRVEVRANETSRLDIRVSPDDKSNSAE